MNHRALRILISLVCGGFAAVHLLYPTINLDVIALGLIAIGLLPWFQPLIKSLELPGGLKIELQDVKAATDKISEGLMEPLSAESAEACGMRNDELSIINTVAEQDPNLALVGLRIEVEKALIKIAKANGIETRRLGAGALVNELSRRALIPGEVASGLRDFVALGNQAAHGATVSKEAAAWALGQAPQLLKILSSFGDQQ